MSYHKSIQAAEQWNLGQLIDALKQRDQTQKVRFDFCWTEPSGEVHSYRGYYYELGVGWRDYGSRGLTGERSPRMSVAVLLARLERAVGETFTGWKGGEYEMGRATPLWVDNYGDGGSTAIVGIADCNYETVIATAYEGR